MRSHPDRSAATLANLATAKEEAGTGPYETPGQGARDCRIDLKLLVHRALQACNRSPAARARLDEFDPMLRPDLWAGTVQDGVARGFAVALEEAISLAPPETGPTELEPDPVHTQVFAGKELRRKKDLLVKSAGARVRFSRKGGLQFVDRQSDANVDNCLWFEDRTDHGTLDEFVPEEGTRPRLFSAQFLQPVRYVLAPGQTSLQLVGRLGRGPKGFPCELTITGREDESAIRLQVVVDNRHGNHRLRVRFRGMRPEWIRHDCTDVREIVANEHGGFVAFSLVRSTGLLRVDHQTAAVLAAQCLGPIAHRFWLGAR